MSSEISLSKASSATSVAQRVHAIAERSGDRIALKAGNAAMSYAELDARAGRLATALRSNGVRREVPVGIALERSFNQIIAVLAVLRAGGSFLPLDPAWPEERLRTLLDDAQASIVVTASTLASRLSGGKRTILDLDGDFAELARVTPSLPVADVGCDDVAYIIYTSGTSSGPKGVEITHANLLNLISWHQEAFSVTASDCGGHVAGLGFDAAVWETWPYLCAGATVALPDEAVRRSADLLRHWLIAESITIAFVPTGMAEQLIAFEWPTTTALRLLLTGGDTLRAYPRPGLPFTLVNNYGPTECTVVATSGVVPPSSTPLGLPSIGRPIDHTRIFLLDEKGRMVPDGETGEIYIGGACVGRGYRNRRDQTVERFVAAPSGVGGEGRLYRTGDLGAKLPDGTIAFRGRVDDQIKIRGYRVEPDEIAGVLNRHPAVASSVVVARGRNDAIRLVAYFVPTGDVLPTWRELRAFLATTLPDYMVPSLFLPLASLPVTPNGKIDRAALPDPGLIDVDGDRARAPASPTEDQLTRIIAEVSGAQHVEAGDNFFLIGGHSLSGTQVVMHAREAFGVDVTLRHLFEAETIADLALVIERLAIERVEAMGEDEARRLLEGSP